MLIHELISRRLFFLPLLFLACGLFAQNPNNTKKNPGTSTPGEAITTFKANTRVVLLDVIVTDKHGRLITDLNRDDLTIVEQGKQQKIASFALVDSKNPPAVAVRPLSPGVYFNGPEVEAQKAPITVLLLDALNTGFADQAAGRYQMLKYVDQHNGQRMAIFGLTDSLLLLQNFTDDPDLLRRTIARRGVNATPLFPRESADLGAAPVFTSPGGLSAAGVDHFFEQFATVQANSRTSTTLQALKAISRWLSGYPGRKKLIWIAGSFPVQLDAGEIGRFTTQNPYVEEVKETATLLTDAQISVYTIDASGVASTGSSAFSAGSSGLNTQGRVRSGPQLGAAIRSDNSAITASHETMSRFAEQTGGLAFYGRNDMDKALEASIADGSVYYAVSYSPDDKKWDGNFRKLEIKANRPGLELRYRRGYYALDPLRAAAQNSKKVDQEIKSALTSPLLASGISFYGSAQPTAVEVQAKAANEQPKALGAHQAEVRFLVDTQQISFEPVEENQQHCNLKFFVGVYSENKLLTYVEKTLDGSLKPESFANMAKAGMLFHTNVEVPDGKVRLRLIVRDNRSGRVGALDVPYPNEVAAK